MIVGNKEFYTIQTGSIINGALSLEVLDMNPEEMKLITRDTISGMIVICSYQFIQALPNVMHVYVTTGSSDANKKVTKVGYDS